MTDILESSAGDSKAKISIARAVGSMLRPVRTNSGSSNRLRKRDNAALMFRVLEKAFGWRSFEYPALVHK